MSGPSAREHTRDEFPVFPGQWFGGADNGIPASNVQTFLEDLAAYKGELEATYEALRRANGELVHLRDKYVDLFDAAPVGYLTVDAEGTVLEANAAVALLLGVGREQLQSRTLAEFVDDRDRGRLTRHLGQVFSTGQRASCLCTLKTAVRGDVFIQLEMSVATGGPSGPFGRVVLVPSTDLDRRVQAVAVEDTKLPVECLARSYPGMDGARLRDSDGLRPDLDVSDFGFGDLFNLADIQKVQDSFAKGAGVASIITDPQGRPITQPSNFRRLCQDSVCRSNEGWDRCLAGPPGVEVVDPAGPVIRRCPCGLLWGGWAAISIGDRHVASWFVGQVRLDDGPSEDGDEEEVGHARMSRERFESVCQAIFLMARQLSELAVQNVQQGRAILQRRQAERMLAEAKRQADAANLAKSQFLANMSHEIRTPMTAILGFTEMLLEQSRAEDVDPERLETIETIGRNGKHLLGIINDILDLSKIEAGQLRVEVIECSPFEVIDDVCALMRGRAKERGIGLTVEYDFPVPTVVRTDPTRLRQVLVNLVGNAIKFTKEGGVAVKMGYRQGAVPKLCIEVADTGIGMTTSQVEKIFRPFAQGDDSVTRKYGGTGLGLAISRRLARMLGGDIEVESEIEHGSTFRLTIAAPHDEHVEMRGEARDEQTVARHTLPPRRVMDIRLDGHILLAEDCADNQRFIQHMLTRAGATVVIVDNGQAAVEAAWSAHKTGAPFDVVLMDVQMPVMDGYEATQSLRGRGYDGPVVALTAQDDRAQAIRVGCNELIEKPVDRKGLILAVKALLDEQAGVVPDVDRDQRLGVLGGCRILLAEDNLSNRRLIDRMLRKAGADVTVVGNGAEAVATALATREVGGAFDIILFDLQMPVMTGYEAVAMLRNRQYDVPMVAITAYAMEGDRGRCLDAGFDEYVTKPIDFSRLTQLIQMLVPQVGVTN